MTSPTTIIDCDTCVMQHTPACSDCVVTYLCDREPEQAVVIEIADLRAMRMLADAGLVPELRHQPAAEQA
ncbi:MAG: hypothetical protein HKN94_11915 [Acidimicrobiales bacterium]|nr:hypothetical protein [Acidimicrobiales bacterium]RZV47126.1 MAG: hypothetical protein EX269_05475 [Acidimicrobiales bacterium]